MISPEPTRLPQEMSDRFTSPLLRFLRIEALAGATLFLAAVAALILSNSAWAGPFHALWRVPLGIRVGSWAYARPMQDWINDGLMTLFFFIVALELKRELVLGELRHVRIAALSFAGALGGMVVPAAIYLLMIIGHDGIHGWGTVMPTDTAFVIGCLALLGSRIPPALRLFLLSLAIFDDIGAIIVTTVGYGHALHMLPLMLSIGGLAAVVVASRIGIKSMPIYVLLGCTIWFCIDASGIHPTFTGVVLGLMTPTGAWIKDARLRAILENVLTHEAGERWSGDTSQRRDLRIARTAVTEALSPLERLEILLHPWVAFIVIPIFAFANAGVTLSGTHMWQPVSTAILAGLVIGKPVGVLTFSWIAVRLGLARQTAGLHWPLLAAGSLLTGIGFTMSLFIAGQAYPPELLNAARIGILGASTLSALIGLAFLVLHGFMRRER